MTTPVAIILLPHNRRCALWPGDRDADGEEFPDPRLTLLTMPIPMPQSILVTTGKSMDDILAIDVLDAAGSGRIPRAETQRAWKGICQFNRDIASRDGDAAADTVQTAATIAAIIDDDEAVRWRDETF